MSATSEALTTRNYLVDTSAEQCVAIIYAISDLNCYLVELLRAGKSTYISDNKEENTHFATQSAAAVAAKKQGAQTLYLALDNTYDECGSPSPEGSRFSYVKIS